MTGTCELAADACDPYYHLLGISPRQRQGGQIDHYCLLGIALGESDAIVIESAADQRMEHLRTFRHSARFAKAAEALLNEVARARCVLIDAAAREANVAARQPAAPVIPIADWTPPTIVAPPPLYRRQASRARGATKHPLRLLVEVVGGGLGGIALSALLLQFALGVDVFGFVPASRVTKQERTALAASSEPVPDSHNPASAIPTAKSPATSTPAKATKAAARDSSQPAAPASSLPAVELQAPAAEPSPMPQSKPVVAATQPAVADRLPVPSPEQRKRACQDIVGVFGNLTIAVTAERKRELAKQMLEIAPETTDVALRFTLLEQSLQLYGTAGELDSALSVLKTMSEQFEFSPMHVKANKLPQFASSISTDASWELLHENMKALIDEAVAQDEPEMALDSVEALRECSRAKSRASLAALLDQSRRSLRQLKAELDKFKTALAKLKANPNDGEANQSAGLWYCSRKGDWSRALPYLAKAGNPAVSDAARKDLDGPSAVAEQVALADTWYNLARGKGQKCFEQRAAFWYGQALPAMAGFERARIARRLQSVPQPAAPQMPADAK